MATVGVYGATGYTGRLVARELLDRGHAVVLSGRRRDALQALAEQLGDVEIRPASLEALHGAFKGLDAVVNCAGPFVRYGEPVVAAAVDDGVHYLDTTGERPWMRHVYEVWDQRAREAGVALVPAMGFDYVPGDLLAALVGGPRQPLREMRIAYAVSGFGATRGTTRSALEMLAAEAGQRPMRARFDFGPPLGEQAVTRYPSAEPLTVPRHLEVREVTSLITPATIAPSPRLAPVVPYLAPVFGLALRTPLKRMLDRAIDRLPEGPTEEERRAARFTIAVEASGEDGTFARGVVRGSDVYGLTAVIAAHGASLLTAGEGRDTGGLAPAEAFDPRSFLDALAPAGVEYEVESAPAGAAV